MTDLAHYYGNDLTFSANGDLLTTQTTVAEGQQRVLRRLLTNAALPDGSTVPDYIWHVTYGAGVAQRIGDPANVPAIKALIRSQIFMEASVARDPEPLITVAAIASGISCIIKYVDATTRQQAVLNFDVSV